ncbi:MAG TPA: plastocyanin/azurin family copper-binding protein [Thermoleophilaceae bacterium]|nr:plastocyanin/azurin family copper-binding protein [Thermoleophilaceae bacterium]
MTRKPLALALAIATMGLAAGCGGDDDEDSGSAATTEAPAETAPAEEAPAGGGETATVDTKDIVFIPREITVAAGATITWTNSDEFDHTVTKESGPGAEFDKPLPGGGSVELTFDEPGTIEYVCTIHPGQDGTITVE